MGAPIRLRFAVCPIEDQSPTDTIHVDIQFNEDDLQTLDERHGLQDFIEKFVEPGLVYLLDQFQQYYAGPEDLMNKTVGVGRPTLPRSVEFYREKVAMMKAKRAGT